METTRISIRFYEELNDFIKGHPLKETFPFAYTGRRSVKDLIESFNVPHVEVDLILVNGSSVDFSYIPESGDRISAYPVFESFNIAGVKAGTSCLSESASPPIPLREHRFILDVHLGKLARLLRLLGFDTDYKRFRDDPELAEISRKEGRILLTRDRGLVKRRIVSRGIYIRSQDPMEQALQVLDRLDIRELARPFSLCAACGGRLEPISPESSCFQECLETVPPRTRAWCREYSRCKQCGKVFWRGAHWERLEEKVGYLLKKKPIQSCIIDEKRKTSGGPHV